ncbi:hypothetical protein [Pseudomonas sp. NPDC089396]|uniref:hypothetical protein n=1 Tax=Pseudomonas sp. NPDC089396 TaxID=3364461 RepID=UPI0038390F71
MYIKERIVRHTSPEKAIAIAKTGDFILKFKDPMNLDSGLNGFIKNRMNEYNTNQELTDKGAILEFEWAGDFVELLSATEPPLPPNILIHQPPWRAHIRGPIDCNKLRLVSIKFSSAGAIDELIEYPWWIDFLPFGRAQVQRYIKFKFIKELRNTYMKEKRFIRFIVNETTL